MTEFNRKCDVVDERHDRVRNIFSFRGRADLMQSGFKAEPFSKAKKAWELFFLEKEKKNRNKASRTKMFRKR